MLQWTVRLTRLLALAALLSTGAVYTASAAQYKAEKKPDPHRPVQGIVTDPSDKPIEGAVVQLKNARTLQVRSYISQEDGSFVFQGLDKNIDYTLKATHQGRSSDERTLSSFDSREKPVINLKLNDK